MSPRDFLEDNQQNISSTRSANSPRDFLEEHEPPKESYWESVKKAPGKIISDVSDVAWHGLNAIPGYLDKAKTEVPGLMKLPFQHPLSMSGQQAAGVNEAINFLAQMPLNISKYGSDRLNLTPKLLTNALQKITPEDTTEATNQLFGLPKYEGESLARGLSRNIPNIYGVGKLASITKPSQLFTTKKSIKNEIIRPHDALENRATKAFNEVSQEVNKRGINQVPLNSEIDFNQLRSYFPNTKKYNALLEKAQTGDYNALRKLQTDIYTTGKKNLGSSLEADRMRGAEMLEKRDDINQAIHNHLVSTGNNDLAELLGKARDDWRTLQKTYYNENMNNAIVNMVNKNYRKIPKNLVDVLSEESLPMKNLLDFHPGLQKRINRYKSAQNILNKSIKYGTPAAVGAYLGYDYGKSK